MVKKVQANASLCRFQCWVEYKEQPLFFLFFDIGTKTTLLNSSSSSSSSSSFELFAQYSMSAVRSQVEIPLPGDTD